ncbi:MAG TPA: hypothetical protein DD477_03095 [Spirochaetaceae bacterium]|nr:hypothetical protein [Spirochaetaceae bacterium]
MLVGGQAATGHRRHRLSGAAIGPRQPGTAATLPPATYAAAAGYPDGTFDNCALFSLLTRHL